MDFTKLYQLLGEKAKAIAFKLKIKQVTLEANLPGVDATVEIPDVELTGQICNGSKSDL